MRHYVVNTEDDSIEYYIDHTEDENTGHDVWQLTRSKSHDWSEPSRGETILTITDDGNGFKIKWAEKPEKNRLDYSQTRELQILLTYIQRLDPIDDPVILLEHSDKLRM